FVVAPHNFGLCFFFHSYAAPRALHSFPTRRSSDLTVAPPRRVPWPDYARAFVLSASNSAWLMAPESSSDLASATWEALPPATDRDRKSTRLNSSHVKISYAVFCLKKKKIVNQQSK